MGWTLKQAGEKAGVDLNQISQWEQGVRSPSTLAWRGLAALYGVSVQWLLGEEEADEVGGPAQTNTDLRKAIEEPEVQELLVILDTSTAEHRGALVMALQGLLALAASRSGGQSSKEESP